MTQAVTEERFIGLAISRFQRLNRYGEPMWDKWGLKAGQFLRENTPYQLLAGKDEFFIAKRADQHDLWHV